MNHMNENNKNEDIRNEEVRNNGSMNILVVTMSLINPKTFQEEEYSVAGEDSVTGSFTNEAPCKYLARTLYKDISAFFDRVIVLATRECREQVIESSNPSINGLTTVQYFEQMLLSYMEQLDPDRFRLFFPTEKEKRDIFRYVSVGLNEELQENLIKAYSQNIENSWDANVYMDFTGGYRQESLAGLMVSRCLDAAGYRIQSVVYSYYSRDKKKPNQICDITRIYQMFDAIIAQSNLRNKDFAGVRESELQKSKDRGISIDFDAYGGSESDAWTYAKPYNGNRPYIFISYAHKDMLFAQSFIKNMQRKGITRIWYDEGIKPSAKWENTIIDRLENCSLFVALLCADYNESEWCRKELSMACGRSDIKILMISKDGSMPLDKSLGLDSEQAIMYRKYLPEKFYDKVMETPGIEKFMDENDTHQS